MTIIYTFMLQNSLKLLHEDKTMHMNVNGSRGLDFTQIITHPFSIGLTLVLLELKAMIFHVLILLFS